MSTKYAYREKVKSTYDSLRESLDESAPVLGAWKVEPMTVDEIDAHPDSARIWATILVLRGDR